MNVYQISPTPGIDLVIELDHILSFLPPFRIFGTIIDPPGPASDKVIGPFITVPAKDLMLGTDIVHAFDLGTLLGSATALARYSQNGKQLSVQKSGTTLSHVQEPHIEPRLTVTVQVII